MESLDEPVRAVSWNLGGFSGRAGRIIFGVYHVGVSVYGYIYEFTDTGIRKTVDESKTESDNPGSTCVVGQFLGKEYMGSTNVHLQEFDTWIANQKYTVYNRESYCVSKNNCAHFAIAAFNRLGVAPPADLKRLCKWTEQYPAALKTANNWFGTMRSGDNQYAHPSSVKTDN